MIRILFLLFIVFIILIFLARILRFSKKHHLGTLKDEQQLVACEYCRRYLPIRHAAIFKEKYFCNLEHYLYYQENEK
jgi:hypothetical protein